MNVTYDLVFPHAPCAILSPETSDILGTHKSILEKETTKRRLGEHGGKLLEVYITVYSYWETLIASKPYGSDESDSISNRATRRLQS